MKLTRSHLGIIAIVVLFFMMMVGYAMQLPH